MTDAVPGAGRHRGDGSPTQAPNLVGRSSCPPLAMEKAGQKRSALSRGDYGRGALLRRGEDWSRAVKGEQDFPTNETSRANQEVTARAK